MSSPGSILNESQHSYDLLYSNAPLTTNESWNAIMEFWILNSLSYKAVESLLQLLKLHCPSPNNLPGSFYKLKKYFQKKQQEVSRKQYCSRCDKEVPVENDSCDNRECKMCKAELSQLYVLDFERSLTQMCEGIA